MGIPSCFLHIQILGLDGISLAKKIREKDERVQIVFITGISDHIAVFDKGELIQRDSYEALLPDTNGKYYALWNAQAQYDQVSIIFVKMRGKLCIFCLVF